MSRVSALFLVIILNVSISAAFAQDTLKYATDLFYPPYEYLNGNGQPEGFNIDLVRELAKELGVPVKIKLENWEKVRKDVEVNGTADFCDMFYISTRDSVVDFSIPFDIVYDEIFLNKKTKAIFSINDLLGKTVAVQNASAIEDFVRINYPGIKLVTTVTETDALRLVSENKCFAAIVTSVTGNEAGKNLSLKNLVTYSHAVLPRDYCFVVKHGNAKLLRKLNAALVKLQSDGKIADLRDKWFGLKILGMPEKYFLMIFILSIALLLAIFLWNFTLSKKIKFRTSQLFSSQARHKAMIEALPYFTFLCEKDNTIIDFSLPEGEIVYNHENWSLGKKLNDVFPPEVVEKLEKAFARCLSSGMKEKVEYSLTLINSLHYYEAVITLCEENKFLTLVSDVTDQIKANELLSRKNSELAAINQLNRKVSKSLSIDEVINSSIEGLKLTVGADVIMIFLLENDILKLKAFYSEKLSKTMMEGIPEHELGQCICGIAVSSKIPQYSKNIIRDSRCTFTECKKAGLNSFAALPLLSGNDVVGTIGLASKEERDFEQESEYLETLSKTISNVINNAVLFTKTKQAEESLGESEEKYRTLVEHNPDGIFIVGFDGKFISANNAVVEELGYSLDEIIGKSFWEVVPEEYMELHLGRLNNILTNKNLNEPAEYEIIKKNGERIIAEIRSAPYIKDGKIIGFQGIARNITDRKKYEEELQKLTGAVKQSPVSVVITDKYGKIEYVNPKLSEVSGYTLDELKGKNPRIFQSGDKTKLEYSKLWETLLKGEEWRGEFYNKKKDGTFFWESASISSIKDSEGNITHFIAVKEDITEKKKTLEELILAKEKAENANKTKDLFLANMSHELRTPLIGILGYSDLLEEVLPDAEHTEMARGIKRSGNRLLNTLNLLLDLTRIESDKFELTISNHDLEEEIKFVYEMFRGAAIEKKLDFNVRILETGLIAKVDPALIKVILENLVNNAIKFTQAGSITIIAGRVDVHNIYIKVKDTGIGIDKKHYNKIFEEFRQVSEGINREFQGTGLGLSISRKCVEILHGTINVESEFGKGSVFTVTLPSA